jgi:hypothetical protein
MSYSTPMLVFYGDSSDLIKGDCGWGIENFVLDKTDYYEYKYLDCVMTVTCDVFDDCHCSITTACTTKQPPDVCRTDDDC